MWKRNKGKDSASISRRDIMLEKFPNLNKLLSEEPGLTPWFQRNNRQVFNTSRGLLTWSTPGDELFLLNGKRDVVGIVRHGTKVKQIDDSRLLVTYETRYLNRRCDDPDNRNALDISVVRIDNLPVIKDFQTESLKMKKQGMQFLLGGRLDAHCAVPLKVSEGIHGFIFPDGLKFMNEVLHLSDYLPRERFPEQFPDIALFIIRPNEDQYEVFPQDWYNEIVGDPMYEGPEKAVRDPVSGRIFLRNSRIRDIVLDETNRKGELR